MDVLSELLTDPEIAAYFRRYPQAQWNSVLRATVLYGIASLRALKSAGLPVNVLDDQTHFQASIVPQIKVKLRKVKGQLEEIDRCLGDTETGESQYYEQSDAKAMLRSASVPSRAKGEKRVQPTQKNDYATLIYPEWWPNDPASTASSSKGNSGKKTVRPKVYVARSKVPTPVAPAAKPTTHTIGTSTSLQQIALQPEKSTHRSFSRPLKLASPTQSDLPSQSVQLRPSSAVRVPSSHSSIDERPSSNDQRPSSSDQRPSSSEQRPSSSELQPAEQRPTSRKWESRIPGATWTGELSSYIKRSSGRSSQESTAKAHLRDLGRKDRKLDTSSDSSISTYRPSEELKAFYRNEHERLCSTRSKGMAATAASAQMWRDSEESESATDSFARY